MDIVERAGKIIALPFALAWLLATYGVMTASIIGGALPVGLYSTGKYIVTGDGGITIPKYLDKSFIIMDHVSTLPLNILMNNPQPSLTNVIKESNGTPKSFEEMKEIREKMDQDILHTK